MKGLHERAGHQGISVIRLIADQLRIKDKGEYGVCVTCLEGKPTRAPIGKEAHIQYKATEPVEALHSDLVVDPGIYDPISKRKVQIPTFKRHRYLLVITDEVTHTVWVYLLRNKDEAADIIKQLILFLYNQTGRSCRRFSTDGGGEYVNDDLTFFFEQNQIIFKNSPAYTPELNGTAERMNRTLFEMARCMLLQAGCHPAYWGEAVVWAAHVYNVTPHPVCGNKSPFELMFNYKYDLKKLHIWGCDVLVQVSPPKKTKLGSRVWKGVFMGFDRATSSYRIMRVHDKRFQASRNVNFLENSFTLIRGKADNVDTTLASMGVSVSNTDARTTYTEDNQHLESEQSVPPRVEPRKVSEPVESPLIMEEPDEAEPNVPDESPHSQEEPDGNNTDASFGTEEQEPEVHFDESPDDSAEPEYPDESHDHDEVEPDPDHDEAEGTVEPGNGLEESKSDSQLIEPEEKQNEQATVNSNSSNSILRTRSGRVVKPTQSLLNNPDAYDPQSLREALNERIVASSLHEEIVCSLITPLYSHDELAYSVSVFANGTVLQEPSNYQEAVRSSSCVKWDDAMRAEIASLKDRDVYDLVSRHDVLRSGRKILKGGWVFKIKLDQDNNIAKHKARFVAKGYLQVYGRDFLDTHSPVARIKSIRLVLSIAAAMDFELHQLDFDTAFLNAPVEEDIYMEQPEGYNEDPSKVWKLNKSLYGLKQASRNWNKEIHTHLVTKGAYTQLKSDVCIYFKRSHTGRLIILALYVDDTIIAVHEQDIQEWYQDKKNISEKYSIKDLGECQWILNMKVTRDRQRRVITLSQQAYIERLVKEYDLEQCKYANTPAENSDLSEETADQTKSIPLNEKEHERYRSLVGAIMYIANITRLDIAFRTGQLARFVSQPYKHHWKAAIRVLRYLRHNADYVATFGLNRSTNGTIPLIAADIRRGTSSIQAYSDADWAGCKATRRSTSGGIIRFNGDIISWISKRQKTVALSTAEAEYIALTETAKEIRWLQQWIQEMFGMNIKGIIKCDNRAAILLGGADTIHERTKHFDLKLHFIREQITMGNIALEWVESAQQHADLLTKVLPPTTFLRLRDEIMSRQI